MLSACMYSKYNNQYCNPCAFKEKQQQNNTLLAILSCTAGFAK